MKKKITASAIGILCIMLIVSFALAGCKKDTAAETTAAETTAAATEAETTAAETAAVTEAPKDISINK
jgi:ABC-type enterochelin transport system substrate-binding protein